MRYTLENKNEGQRLKNQAFSKHCNAENELGKLSLSDEPLQILDAGCGPGTITSMLAAMNSKYKVTGCDASLARINEAKRSSAAVDNIQFEVQDLLQLDFQDEHFDVVVCRYVLHHFNKKTIDRALFELARVLKPGGKLVLIEMDGILENIYPRTQIMNDILEELKHSDQLDINLARKLPYKLEALPFLEVSISANMVESINEENKHERSVEAKNISSRLDHFLPQLADIIKSEERARRFVSDYKGVLALDNSVFYDIKFVLQATKVNKVRH